MLPISTSTSSICSDRLEAPTAAPARSLWPRGLKSLLEDEDED